MIGRDILPLLKRALKDIPVLIHAGKDEWTSDAIHVQGWREALTAKATKTDVRAVKR